MRLAKTFIALTVLCLAMQGQAKAQSFTPPNPPAVYAPANYTGASATLLGTVGKLQYYKCPQSGVTFTVPVGTPAASIKLRAGYTCSNAKFVIDCGAAMSNPSYRLAASNWFVLNVNPLWGY
jgi:hypothetical protein